MHKQLQFPLISSELGDNTFNQWANKCSSWLLSPPCVHVLTEKVNKITSTAIIKWHPNSITSATFWKYHTAVKINHFLVGFLFPSTCHCCLTLWMILSKSVRQKDRLDLPHTLCLFSRYWSKSELPACTHIGSYIPRCQNMALGRQSYLFNIQCCSN